MLTALIVTESIVDINWIKESLDLKGLGYVIKRYEGGQTNFLIRELNQKDVLVIYDKDLFEIDLAALLRLAHTFGLRVILVTNRRDGQKEQIRNILQGSRLIWWRLVEDDSQLELVLDRLKKALVNP